MSNDLELEQAREALAETFRVLGAEPVVPRHGTDVLYRDCEAWALHLLAGGAAPGLAATAGSEQRRWSEARLALRSLRQGERVQVQQRERELAALTGDLLAGLRDAGLSMGQSAAAVDNGLEQIRKLIATHDIQRLRTGVIEVAAQLRATIASQRAALDAQLRELRERVAQAERAQADSASAAEQLELTLSELRQALEDARERMQVDPLTRIYNRGAFDVALQRYTELAHASGQTLGLILLDLDHFKKINDTHGHLVGDRVLRSFADLLSRSFLRADDFVARFGGEEFAVLLFAGGDDVVARLAGTVLERLRNLDLPELAAGWQLSCSAGYALLRAGEHHEALFQRADGALYRAKNNGRDQLAAG